MQRQSFSFKVLKVDDYNIDCEVSVGDWTMQLSFDDYGTDLEVMRHALESACYDFKDEPREKVMGFEFEYSTATISIKSTVDGNCLVSIKPSEPFWAKPTTLCCEKKQVIREIYESLLAAALNWDNFKYDSEHLRDKAGIIYYNKLKSPIIEAYLNGSEAGEGEVGVRQVIVNHLLIINPDSDYLFSDENDCCFGIEKDNIYYDNASDDVSIKVPGIHEWWMRYVQATDFVKCATDSSFDYNQWHKEGLELARTLRTHLPDNYDLWYGCPYEDEKRRHSRPLLVTKDYESPIKI